MLQCRDNLVININYLIFAALLHHKHIHLKCKRAETDNRDMCRINSLWHQSYLLFTLFLIQLICLAHT